MEKKKLKYKMRFCHAGIIIDENKTKEQQHQDLVRQIAEELISKGFVTFNEVNSKVADYKFVTATVYAVKLK